MLGLYSLVLLDLSLFLWTTSIFLLPWLCSCHFSYLKCPFLHLPDEILLFTPDPDHLSPPLCKLPWTSLSEWCISLLSSNSYPTVKINHVTPILELFVSLSIGSSPHLDIALTCLVTFSHYKSWQSSPDQTPWIQRECLTHPVVFLTPHGTFLVLDKYLFIEWINEYLMGFPCVSLEVSLIVIKVLF